jgi:CrcB protein
MKSLLLIGLGGGIGAMARHSVGRVALHWPNLGFPIATFTVNVLGGLAMGLLIGWLALQVDGGKDLRLFFGVGLLGGFTTFSAFSLEVVQMVQRKAMLTAGLYATGSVVLSILALMAGLMLARKIFAL